MQSGLLKTVQYKNELIVKLKIHIHKEDVNLSFDVTLFLLRKFLKHPNRPDTSCYDCKIFSPIKCAINHFK